MVFTVEWRISDETDAIALVDEAGTVTKIASVNAEVLKDYLAVAADLDRWRKWTCWNPTTADRRDPEELGALVMGRSDSGDVLVINPELFWERVYRWFRSRKMDYNT